MNRESLHERITALITSERDPGGATRDALLADLVHYQKHIPPYARLLERRKVQVALPTDVFRFARVAAHDPAEDVRVFRTSGTTHGARGEHAFTDLTLYNLAARVAAKRMLFPDVDRMKLVVVAPSEAELPDSSLSYMLSRFAEWFGSDVQTIWPLDARRLEQALDTAEPVALLGTSFAFVHADDALSRRFTLAPGSRIMQTGGFKGRSRELDPIEMRAMLSGRYGVPETHVVSEYGMTELSSQMYETSLVDALAGVVRSRRYWAPWWVRASPVDPNTLEPRDEGILRIDDCANLDSVSAIQTADRARRLDAGFVLLGRDQNSVPRGCSLAIEEALGALGER